MYKLKPVEKFITVESLNSAIDHTHKPGFVFAGEMHNFWEAVFVESGKAVASADEQIFNLHTGQILFHRPMQFHRIKTDGQSPVHLRIISFSALGIGMEEFERKCYDLNSAEIKDYLNVFSLVGEACASYEESNITNRYSILSSKACAALESFLLNLREHDESKMSELSNDERHYKEIVTVMSENCEKWLTIDDISELCRMSSSNMKRIFSLFNDIGVSKYFLSLKIRRATELLRDNVPSAEIAERLGFSSVNYFYTTFRRETGMTPKAYKKQLK